MSENRDGKTVLSEEDRRHFQSFLVEAKDMDRKVVEAMTDAELMAHIRKVGSRELAFKKNPNSFWILKDLPEPPVVEPKTSKKWGIVVAVALVVALLGFLVGMLLWALL